MKTTVVSTMSILLGSSMLFGLSFDTNYEMSPQIFDHVSFIRHESPDFGSYLAQNIPYDPINGLKEQLAHDFGVDLQARGEAHITVITPVEYKAIKSVIDITEINDLVQRQIQEAHFTPLCIGKGQLGSAMTFFVVVEALELLAIRTSIETLFIERGGDATAFQAAVFYPHITIGFTHRDLHAQDGIIKDQHACIAGLDIN